MVFAVSLCVKSGDCQSLKMQLKTVYCLITVSGHGRLSGEGNDLSLGRCRFAS